MNSPILPHPQSPVVTSTAFRFGVEDAQQGDAFAPEAIFAQRQQQIEYSLGFESVRGISEATSQFTSSTVPNQVIVPNYKANDRERVRRTDNDVTRIFQLAESRDRRLDDMIARTAAEFPWATGDIILA